MTLFLKTQVLSGSSYVFYVTEYSFGSWHHCGCSNVACCGMFCPYDICCINVSFINRNNVCLCVCVCVCVFVFVCLCLFLRVCVWYVRACACVLLSFKLKINYFPKQLYGVLIKVSLAS